MAENSQAAEAIRKKLLGKNLSYAEIFTIMNEIAAKKLGPVLTTYFAAAGFQHGFSEDELYHLTKAMVETGKKLHFKGMVADKHSTGGVAGTRTTMIIVPIIAACGIKIPKNSSRAITSASGTADTMEVLAKVNFSITEIEKMVNKIGGCIVWGGHLGIAPADDIIIQVEEPLAFESFDKIIVSIMAKKVASGATHLVLDIPVGPTMKIRHFKDAEMIAEKFRKICERFHIKVTVDINQAMEPSGRGVGPILECRDVLEVLEQTKNRPIDLENKAVRLAGKLLDLCFKDLPMKKGQEVFGEDLAREALTSGRALTKMKEIIKMQGGNPNITSAKLKLAKNRIAIRSKKAGNVVRVDNKKINAIARILGSPDDKAAGIYLEKKIGESVKKDEILFTLYSSDKYRLKEGAETISSFDIYALD